MTDEILCTICGGVVNELDMDNNPADAHVGCEERIMNMKLEGLIS